MSDPTFYVYEFLYRGRPAGSEQPAAWHVILGINGTDPAGRPYEPLPIMTAEQAAAAGHDLPAIIAAINADTLAQLEANQASAVALQDQLDGATAALSASEQTIADLQQQLSAALNPAGDGEQGQAEG